MVDDAVAEGGRPYTLSKYQMNVNNPNFCTKTYTISFTLRQEGRVVNNTTYIWLYKVNLIVLFILLQAKHSRHHSLLHTTDDDVLFSLGLEYSGRCAEFLLRYRRHTTQTPPTTACFNTRCCPCYLTDISDSFYVYNVIYTSQNHTFTIYYSML